MTWDTATWETTASTQVETLSSADVQLITQHSRPQTDNGSHYKLVTPYLDQLASQGMRFTDSYAGAPVCAPSRCTLITGLHSGHCTVRANGQFLTAKDASVASVLSKAGYDTAMFGKWGLGNINETDPSSNYNDPISKGFDYYYGQVNQENCHNYFPSFQWLGQKKVDIPRNSGASNTTCGYPDWTELSVGLVDPQN